MKKFFMVLFLVMGISGNSQAAADLCGIIGGECLAILNRRTLEGTIVYENQDEKLLKKEFSQCINDYKNLECSMDKLKDVYTLAQTIKKIDWNIMTEINKIKKNSFSGRDIAKVLVDNYFFNVFDLDVEDMFLATERCSDSFGLCDIIKENRVDVDNKLIAAQVAIYYEMRKILQNKKY